MNRVRFAVRCVCVLLSLAGSVGSVGWHALRLCEGRGATTHTPFDDSGRATRPLFLETLDVNVPHVSTDPSVKIDHDRGLDLENFEVRTDFKIGRFPAGSNLTAKFQPKPPSVWEPKLAQPVARIPSAKLTVTVKDRQSHWSRMERSFFHVE